MGGLIKGAVEGIQAFGNDPKYAEQEREQLALGDAQAKLFNFAAAQERKRGEQQAQLTLIKGGQMVGQQRAALGASGVDANTGSAAEAQVATKMFAALDASRQQGDASRSAWNYEMKAKEAQTDAIQRAKKLEEQRNNEQVKAGGDFAGGLVSLFGEGE